MSTISLRLPDSLHKKARELARDDHVSINQFITTALAEKISAFLSKVYFEKRERRASKKTFLKVLSKIKKMPPEEIDRL